MARIPEAVVKQKLLSSRSTSEGGGSSLMGSVAVRVSPSPPSPSNGRDLSRLGRADATTRNRIFSSESEADLIATIRAARERNDSGSDDIIKQANRRLKVIKRARLQGTSIAEQERIAREAYNIGFKEQNVREQREKALETQTISASQPLATGEQKRTLEDVQKEATSPRDIKNLERIEEGEAGIFKFSTGDIIVTSIKPGSIFLSSPTRTSEGGKLVRVRGTKEDLQPDIKREEIIGLNLLDPDTQTAIRSGEFKTAGEIFLRAEANTAKTTSTIKGADNFPVQDQVKSKFFLPKIVQQLTVSKLDELETKGDENTLSPFLPGFIEQDIADTAGIAKGFLTSPPETLIGAGALGFGFSGVTQTAGILSRSSNLFVRTAGKGTTKASGAIGGLLGGAYALDVIERYRQAEDAKQLRQVTGRVGAEVLAFKFGGDVGKATVTQAQTSFYTFTANRALRARQKAGELIITGEQARDLAPTSKELSLIAEGRPIEYDLLVGKGISAGGVTFETVGGKRVLGEKISVPIDSLPRGSDPFLSVTEGAFTRTGGKASTRPGIVEPSVVRGSGVGRVDVIPYRDVLLSDPTTTRLRTSFGGDGSYSTLAVLGTRRFYQFDPATTSELVATSKTTSGRASRGESFFAGSDVKLTGGERTALENVFYNPQTDAFALRFDAKGQRAGFFLTETASPTGRQVSSYGVLPEALSTQPRLPGELVTSFVSESNLFKRPFKVERFRVERKPSKTTSRTTAPVSDPGFVEGGSGQVSILLPPEQEAKTKQELKTEREFREPSTNKEQITDVFTEQEKKFSQVFGRGVQQEVSKSSFSDTIKGSRFSPLNAFKARSEAKTALNQGRGQEFGLFTFRELQSGQKPLTIDFPATSTRPKLDTRQITDTKLDAPFNFAFDFGGFGGRGFKGFDPLPPEKPEIPKGFSFGFKGSSLGGGLSQFASKTKTRVTKTLVETEFGLGGDIPLSAPFTGFEIARTRKKKKKKTRRKK